MEKKDEGKSVPLPLFESKVGRGRAAHKLYVAIVLTGFVLILVYRLNHVPPERSCWVRWVWYGMFLAELWFSFYWILTQALRWRPIFRNTFRERLLQRFGNELPAVDIFVCAADPKIEPPLMVINTVLSVMAYNYLPEKLSVYLSDDGGSELTLYALLEAARFARYWLPFCRRFNIKPRSPGAFFSANTSEPHSQEQYAKDCFAVKKMYEDMKSRIESVTELGKIPDEDKSLHKTFAEWTSEMSPKNHQTILDILVDYKDPSNVDEEGHSMPTLVYLAREKRAQHFHNFKAGAMNALIRVSSEISNGQIILNVDCDMYSNNPETVREALCFLMDEEKGQEIAYVQLPQRFINITKNDLYDGAITSIMDVEFLGLDGFAGPFYTGTGCFHRRDTLCGMRYSKDYKPQWTQTFQRRAGETKGELIEKSKTLAASDYDENTKWGKEMGLKYGFVVEDLTTGLSIQCRGWKSAYFVPSETGFLGVAPITLEQSLVQHKRWAEGDLQIFLSKHCPFTFGRGKIPFGLQLGYTHFCFWPLNAMPTLYYLIVPSLYLSSGVPLFPKITSLWFIPFAYVNIAYYTYSLIEMIWCGKTIKTWINYQRMMLFRRTTSYVFAIIDIVPWLLGLSKSAFVITAKVGDEEVSKRYDQEIMEFGSSSPMFIIIATIAILNLHSLASIIVIIAMDKVGLDVESLILQLILCCCLVIINIPVYEALFIRRDKGRIPFFVTIISLALGTLPGTLLMRSSAV